MTEPGSKSARQIHRHLVGLYVQGSAAAVVVVSFLILIGLEFTGRQWLLFIASLPAAISLYVIPDIFLIRRHYRPLGAVLSQFDDGLTPTPADVRTAIVRALNLPYYSFLRVVLFHGPAAAIAVLLALASLNRFFNAQFADWQTLTVATIVFFFASPTHAIFEFFSVSRAMARVIERLYPHAGTLDRIQQSGLRRIDLRKKLLYLAIFVTSLPLLFLAGSVTFKMNLLVNRFGVEAPPGEIPAFLLWVYGVVAVCMVGALIMSVLTAREVSSSAAKLGLAMNRVEGGDLDVRLQITSTDEYADLFRGFNLMTAGLSEEVKILGISQALMGELNLDVLLGRIMRATTELLDADRSTLFLHDAKTGELFSRFAEGLESREIRIPAQGGIAGSVFTTGESENIRDASADPRFNSEIDRRTGYRTETILAIPVVNKSGGASASPRCSTSAAAPSPARTNRGCAPSPRKSPLPWRMPGSSRTSCACRITTRAFCARPATA